MFSGVIDTFNCNVRPNPISASVLSSVTDVISTLLTFNIKLTFFEPSAVCAVITVLPTAFTFNCTAVSVFSVSWRMLPFSSCCHVSPRKEATSASDDV